ncbi:MAG: hypothetical protein ACFCVK_09440 [Acidimicrobiales bacterium]
MLAGPGALTTSRGGRPYTLHDLQDLDDRCREAARSIGLDVPEIVFQLAPAPRIYDIAARGLPGR